MDHVTHFFYGVFLLSIRSPYLATVLSKTTPTQTISPNLPCFPRNLVLAVSGASNQCSGSALSGQLAATGPSAMCQSLLLNTGTSSPDIIANSADLANASGASSFEFNIEGFDYSKYANKVSASFVLFVYFYVFMFIICLVCLSYECHPLPKHINEITKKAI